MKQIRVNKLLDGMSLKEVLQHVIDLASKHGEDAKLKIVSTDPEWRIDLEIVDEGGG